MPALEIRPLATEEFGVASALVARAMQDNPNHVRAFGPDRSTRIRRNDRLFRIIMPAVAAKGVVLGGFRSGQLVGILGMVAPGGCDPTLGEALRILPRLVVGLGLVGTVRLSRWMSEWVRRDPRVPHWHLGPVAVDRDLKGQGIGTSLMETFCGRMDAIEGGGLAYLETETAENVRFYRKFGFEVVGEARVVGDRNWFMQREPHRT